MDRYEVFWGQYIAITASSSSSIHNPARKLIRFKMAINIHFIIHETKKKKERKDDTAIENKQKCLVYMKLAASHYMTF